MLVLMIANIAPQCCINLCMITLKKFFSSACVLDCMLDWRYYDSAYTERMFGLPSLNRNYNTSSIVKRAGNFGKTKFLVIHGSGDDNVHFQVRLFALSILVLLHGCVRFSRVSYFIAMLSVEPCSTWNIYPCGGNECSPAIFISILPGLRVN